MAIHSQLDELIGRVLPVVQDFHRKAMFAPQAASIDKEGAVKGHALMNDGTSKLTVAQAIDHFERDFSSKAASDAIVATGIFYHSPGIDTSSGSVVLPPANTVDECRTLVALLEHSAGDSVYLLIPYRGEPPSVEYEVGKLVEKPPKIFIRPEVAQKPWWKLW